MKITKFAKGVNRGTKVCDCCKKRTWDSKIDPSTQYCETCYDSAGCGNAHQDGCHEPGEGIEYCPECNDVNCMHEVRDALAATAKAEGK